MLSLGVAAEHHLRRAVQLHGARAQRDHGVHQRDVLVLQSLHVADDLGLGVVRVEDGVRQEGGGPLERGARDPAVQVTRARDRLGNLGNNELILLISGLFSRSFVACSC